MDKINLVTISVILVTAGFGIAYAGNSGGYIIILEEVGQTTNPILVESSDGTDRMTVDPDGDIWSDQNIAFDSGTAFTITLDGVPTADRTITIPDATATLLTTSTNLEELNNVTATGCASNEILKVSGSSWVCATDGGGATTMETLTNVTSTGCADGQQLQVSGTSWVCITPSGGGGFTTVYKSADETTNNDVTLTDDSHLTFAVDANSNYVVIMQLWWIGDSTADMKFAVTLPSGASGFQIDSFYEAKGSSSYDAIDILTVRTGAMDVTTTTPNTQIYNVKTDSTAGSFTIQWAQGSQVVADTTLQEGSFLMYKKLN